jgi:non-heme chloroperoxidase
MSFSTDLRSIAVSGALGLMTVSQVGSANADARKTATGGDREMHQQMKELSVVEDYGEGFRSHMVEWGGMIVSYETGRGLMRASVHRLIALTFALGLLIALPPKANAADITDAYAKVSETFTIHYQTAGNGDIAIVLVPGWTMTTDAFEHQLAYFADSDTYMAVTYDPRSQGLTTHTLEGNYYAQHARDLAALLDHLELSRVVLVGWSAGGGDVLEYVRLFGADKLAGLVLLDTPPKARGTDFTKEWVWFGTKDEGDQDDLLKWVCYDVMIDRQGFNVDFAQWMLEEPTPAKIKFVNDMTNMTADSIAALLSASNWFLDNTPEAKALDGEVPLLYFVREEWEDLASEWAADNTPSATIMALGKHLMFWERHEQFNTMFAKWLDNNV